jgi:hypothetical protein
MSDSDLYHLEAMAFRRAGRRLPAAPPAIVPNKQLLISMTFFTV